MIRRVQVSGDPAFPRNSDRGCDGRPIRPARPRRKASRTTATSDRRGSRRSLALNLPRSREPPRHIRAIADPEPDVPRFALLASATLLIAYRKDMALDPRPSNCGKMFTTSSAIACDRCGSPQAPCHSRGFVPARTGRGQTDHEPRRASASSSQPRRISPAGTLDR